METQNVLDIYTNKRLRYNKNIPQVSELKTNSKTKETAPPKTPSLRSEHYKCMAAVYS